MSALAWLAAALVVVGAYPAYRFARRAWRFRATATVIAVIAGQLVGLALVVLGVVLLPRPDLTGAGWFAVLLAATVLPLAIGDVLQSAGQRGARIAVAAVAAVLTVGVVGVTAQPALARPIVAGRSIPVTAKTLAEGYQLAVRIPATRSGFEARAAHLFVPPGWLRDPSGTRPVVEMMMGQPGNPTLGATLDALHSLGQQRLDQAPFVLVVDQLGAVDKNPPCADTSAGKLDTYLSQDVPAWIDANLPASPDRADRVIAGFSHGGECAAYLGAKYPDTWGAVIDVSGPDKPGEYRPTVTRDRYFGGDQAAYEKTWPANVLAANDYPRPTVGIFVAGAEDPHFRQQVEDTATAAENAGWKVTYWAVPGEGHSGPTLVKGLATGYNQLIGSWVKTGATGQGDRFLCAADQTGRACGLTQAAAVGGTVAMVDLSVLAVFLIITLGLFFARRGVTLRRPRASLDD
ncbi:Putative esterase [Leifsonia sp. 98AMF]|uniref:alpha/beta hydrolase n=1 Tax=unclassified Leifsonia TaxID=2663824 RepID=UPI00087B5BA2|nr:MULTISPECIES: alpha/beta hydrolase-fold protein [unclassified Leifsonia]SDH69648.1 Putative esterase [Leifsonia sp. 197AMF]SDI70240.1 Putative esterase [Leifsonia sp. 466MF]SDK20681.1 Putative esterase [Leifsonia sp. 157MF]SDN72630.1 Putative esterase [Leifsonia sp. 509MF]SEN35691.1 Putative esterase [Leifsonia sp. 467MF]